MVMQASLVRAVLEPLVVHQDRPVVTVVTAETLALVAKVAQVAQLALAVLVAAPVRAVAMAIFISVALRVTEVLVAPDSVFLHPVK